LFFALQRWRGIGRENTPEMSAQRQLRKRALSGTGGTLFGSGVTAGGTASPGVLPREM